MLSPNRFASITLAVILAFAASALRAADFRPPAVPLVTSDPYLSIWSQADHLTDDVTRHWTNTPHPLVSLIRIDGQNFRLMGNDPSTVPALPQTSLKVTPTRTIYEFQNPQIHVTLTFMIPLLPDNLDVFTRPTTYLTWSVQSVDGKSHAVSIYDSTSSALAVNDPGTAVTWQRETAGPLTALKCGAVDQTLFEPRGDAVRINWGYAYAAAPAAQTTSCIDDNNILIKRFTETGTIPATDATPPAAVNTNPRVLAYVFDLGSIGSAEVSRHIIIAYDELYEINLSSQKLLPYWKRNGATMPDLLQSAETDYPSLVQKCQAFDESLMADMTQVGGPRYAQICALAYRESLAATGIAADPNKQPLLFTKENTSNGDIATVDVIFPMNPILLFLSPTLAKASLAPVFLYASSDRWKFPNAPHDLGTYPVASCTGQAGEAMVVEESGNMIILTDAIAKIDGNADFATPWWPQLTQWAQYLKQYGLDPEDQLCTDDFMGHLAHNANLSVKAVVALAAYADLCQRRGDADAAKEYSDLAKADARHWMTAAADNSGAYHYRLAFDKPATWSQKYNLVWDKLLGLNVFPDSVARDEVAYYKTVMQPFGLPLDSRTLKTKTDWTVWTATLADDKPTFESFISPVYDYLNTTTAREPIADSYLTNTLDKGGMHARPVVGGLFIKMLSDPVIWKKWADAGNTTPVGGWAPLHPLPVLTTLVPAAGGPPITWHYITRQPPADWAAQTFDDSKWQQGKAGDWIASNVPEVKHPKAADVWIRTTITLPAQIPTNLQWILASSAHTSGEVYVNGILAGSLSPHDDPEAQDISPEARSLFQPNAQITIAAHINSRRKPSVDIKLGTVN